MASAKYNPRSVRPESFPAPKAGYDQSNEHQFRREVERALQALGGSSNERADELAADANLLLMERVSGSTYDSVQHMQDLLHSAGWTSGGVVTDGGSNTVDVAAGTGFIRATDSKVVTLLFFDWPAVTGLSVPSGTTRYVGVQYNSGTPQAFVKTTDSWDYNTEFPLYSVVNEGGTLHLLAFPHSVGDHANFMTQRLWETQRVAHASGAILGETGTRNVTLTAGVFWAKLNRYATAAQDTSGSDRFDAYYRNGSGGHTKVATQSQWDNNSYDDSSGVLGTMTVNRYGNLWFYMESDGELVCMYGYSNTATLASALDEAPPTDLPDRLVSHSILVGRLTYQNGAGTASQIDSAFETVFEGSQVTDHGNLAGLANDDHTQYVLADESRDITRNSHAAVRRTNNLAVTTGTDTLVVWEAEIDDPGSNFDLANDKYVVPATGLYHITFHVRFGTMAAATYYKGWIEQDGNSIATVSAAATSGQANYLIVAVLKRITAADEITFHVRHEHGSDRDLIGGTSGGSHSRTVAEIVKVGD